MQRVLSTTVLALSLAACGGKSSGTPAKEQVPETKNSELKPAEAPAAAPKSQSQYGLVLALAQFSGATPKPARFELLTPAGGTFKVEAVDDSDSNVFHKVLPLTLSNGNWGLISLGGTKAVVKLYQRTPSGLVGESLWTESFGGKFDRMRDAELGDVDGDGAPDIVVGTHDQGVVAYLARTPDGKWAVNKLDRQANTFIHEIELGDLDGDGVMEIYATPSEPNRLDAGAQSGQVVRYVPKAKQGRKVVADLKNRHAKEILVTDLDADGKDELYVAVEALTKGQRDAVEIVEPVEIRRYDADTPKDAGKVVARIRDRYCRFLSAGDVDGDGKKELVAAAFRSGVWLMRPGADKKAEFSVENIETNSSGFEHAALLADLDADNKDELYVAADDQGELRRYVWKDGKAERTTVLRRDNPRETWTWNIVRVPGALLGD
ncbi:MAG TPA: VCBS repeat-containing protein [Polyangiales bacterium]